MYLFQFTRSPQVSSYIISKKQSFLILFDFRSPPSLPFVSSWSLGWSFTGSSIRYDLGQSTPCYPWPLVTPVSGLMRVCSTAALQQEACCSAAVRPGDAAASAGCSRPAASPWNIIPGETVHRIHALSPAANFSRLRIISVNKIIRCESRAHWPGVNWGSDLPGRGSCYLFVWLLDCHFLIQILVSAINISTRC